MYSNILDHQQRRYLHLALAVVAVSLLIYFSQRPTLPPNGGSWQGYVLGSVAASMMLGLSWLGIRKRRYHSQLGSVQGWTSAHIYLGLALPVVATLHCAFQFGFNIHTLSYVLMWLVILSGLYGLYAYLWHPRVMTDNRGGQSFEQRLAELASTDNKALGLAAQCDPEVDSLVRSGIERSTLGGSFLDQLLARDRSRVALGGSGGGEKLLANSDQETAAGFIAERITRSSKPGEAERLQKLLTLVVRRRELLKRLRREIALQLRLKLWLSLHIPACVALLAALLAHIFSVFFYW